MGPGAVSIDLAAAPGAAVSAVTRLAAGEERTLIELAGLALLRARATDRHVLAAVTNLSPSTIAWSDAIGHAAGVLDPGEACELPAPVPDAPGAPPVPPLCLQLIAAETVALTITVSVAGRPPDRRVLAQALVSS